MRSLASPGIADEGNAYQLNFDRAECGLKNGDERSGILGGWAPKERFLLGGSSGTSGFVLAYGYSPLPDIHHRLKSSTYSYGRWSKLLAR